MPTTDTFANFPTSFDFGASLFATDAMKLANDDILAGVMDTANVNVKIWKSTDGGASFSVLSTPYANASSRSHPYLANDGSTNVYLTVKHTSATNVYFKKSTDSGATFGGEVTVFSVGAETGVTDPKILYISSSLLLCAFRVISGANYEIRVYKSVNDGTSWTSLSTALTVATAGLGSIEDINLHIAPNGDILLGYEHEVAENDHAICKQIRSTDNGSTWGSATTVYDDANTRADNEGGDFETDPDGTTLRYTFSTDEDDRTGTGTSPSYDKNKTKRLSSTDSGANWTGKTTIFDSFSNVEALTVFNGSDEPVLLTTKGYWPSGSPNPILIAVKNFGGYNFSDSSWTIDRATAWITKIGTDNVMRVHGFPHATEPVTGTTGLRAWVSKNVTIADGTFTVDYYSTGSSVRDARVAFRYTDASNHYAVTIDSSSGNIVVNKRVNQTYTPLNTVAHGGFLASTWYTLTVELLGTSIKTYINGVLKNNFTDGTYSTGKIALGSTYVAVNLPVYYRNVVTPGTHACPLCGLLHTPLLGGPF